MGTQIWHRLLWKEFREGAPVLLAGVALPLALLPLHRQGELLLPAIALVAVTIILWAMERARGLAVKRQLLPIPALPQWLTLYIVPLPVPLLAGAVIGVVYSAFRPLQGPAVGPVALLLCTLFLLATVLTRAYAAVPAVLAGVLWLFFAFDAEIPATTLYLTACVAAGALACAGLWEAVAARQKYLLGRILVGVVLLGALGLGGVFREFKRDDAASAPPPNEHVCSAINTDDRHKGMWSSVDLKANSTTITLEHNYKRGADTIDGIARVLAWSGNDAALIAVQPAPKAPVELRRWRYLARRWDTLGPLDVPPVLWRQMAWSPFAASPDGRYTLLRSTATPEGVTADIWIFDAAARRIALAMPGLRQDERMDGRGLPIASWLPDRVLLSGMHRGISIDLATLRGRRLAEGGRP
jgi:hypothetical protein